MKDIEMVTVYCPRCNRRAFERRKNSGMVLSNKCSKCNKLVVYNPRYGVVLKDVPQRQDSSGSRFY